MQTRCLVHGCGGKLMPNKGLCEKCYMSLISGIIPAGTKSFLKCIPYMRELLFKTKESLLGTGTAQEVVARTIELLKDVEGDE